jgi:hypothetical protein
MIHLRCFFVLLFFFGLSTPCFSQKTSDVDFGFYLLESRKFDDLILLFKDIQTDDTPMFDSIHHILGMAHYNKKELEQSTFHLSKVSLSSTLYDKSIFFGALDYAHLGEYAKARTILMNYRDTMPKNTYNDLLTVNLAGLALLERDFETFDCYSEAFKFNDFHYVNSQKELMKIRGILGDFRPKSPFVAGLLSAIVPGVGKVYAGQLGEGVASFLTVGSLAAITAENWVKNGLLDWRTLTFGAIFSVFYIGNIAGSVISVKIYKNQFNDRQNNTILLGIHLPVRSVFN